MAKRKRQTVVDEDVGVDVPVETESAAEPVIADQEPSPKEVEQIVPAGIEKPQAIAYIGPSLPGGKLNRNTVYREGQIPQRIQALIDEVRLLKVLFVPVSKLAAAEKRLSDPSSVEATRFAEVRQHFYKGAK